MFLSTQSFLVILQVAYGVFFFVINSQLYSSKEIIMYEGAINQLLQHSAPSVILERGIHIRYRVWHRIVEVLTKYILSRLSDG